MFAEPSRVWQCRFSARGLFSSIDFVGPIDGLEFSRAPQPFDSFIDPDNRCHGRRHRLLIRVKRHAALPCGNDNGFAGEIKRRRGRGEIPCFVPRLAAPQPCCGNCGDARGVGGAPAPPLRLDFLARSQSGPTSAVQNRDSLSCRCADDCNGDKAETFAIGRNQRRAGRCLPTIGGCGRFFAVQRIGTQRRTSSRAMIRSPCSFRALNVRRVIFIGLRRSSTSLSNAAHSEPRLTARAM